MNYIKVGPGEYLIKQFKSLKELLECMASKEEKNKIWSDFPKIEWKIKVWLAKLIITAKKRGALETAFIKKNYKRKKLYNSSPRKIV